MPAILWTLLSTLGSTLASMGLALLTGPMMKKLIIMIAEFAVERYEERAKSSADKQDDVKAKYFREILTAAEKEWAKT